MPDSSRTVLCPPSQPAMYAATTLRVEPSRALSVVVTWSGACSKATSSAFHCTAIPHRRRRSPMMRSLSSWPSMSTKGNGLRLLPMSPSGTRAVRLPSTHMFAPLPRRPSSSARSAPSELIGEHQSGGAASHDQHVRVHTISSLFPHPVGEDPDRVVRDLDQVPVLQRGLGRPVAAEPD